jgi:hypothetical protein
MNGGWKMNPRAVILSVLQALLTAAAIILLANATRLMDAGDHPTALLLCIGGCVILFITYLGGYNSLLGGD